VSFCDKDVQFVVQKTANLLCKILDYIAAILRQLRQMSNMIYNLAVYCKISLTLSEIIRVTWGLVTEKYKKVTT